MKCHIREMRKGELKRVLRLIRMHDTRDARYASRYYRDYFRRWGRGWDKVVVAESGKRLMAVSGYFYDNRETSGVYWLGYTYVHPQYHGYGVGSQLLKYIVHDLRRRDARKLFLATSSDSVYGGAVSFYTSHGFRWEGALKDLYGPGEDQIIMGKDLRKKKRRPKKVRRKRRGRKRVRKRRKSRRRAHRRRRRR
jgi:ribosomal protein S18 acetylase RimI-like enzyme